MKVIHLAVVKANSAILKFCTLHTVDPSVKRPHLIFRRIYSLSKKCILHTYITYYNNINH